MDLRSARPTVFLATAKADDAKAFYSEVIGLEIELDDQYALVYQIAGVELRLSKVPVHKPLPFTVLDWQVDDIEETHAVLSSRGVEFVIFEGMGQDARGVWVSPDGRAKILWFKDPDGNVLSVSERS